MFGKKFLILFIVLVVTPNVVFSQVKENKPSENTSKPLELPNFIIEGKVQLNIKSGTKEFPQKPLPLNSSELDSINSLEKQQPLLLSAEPLPSNIMNTSYNKGYVEAEIGRFGFGLVDIGYDYKIKDYTFFGNAKFDLGGEYVKNSDYNRFYLNLNSDYIAPKKFFIFGGSKTRTSLELNTRSFKKYAYEYAPERDITDFNIGIKSDGSYSGFVFSTGASFSTIQLRDNFNDSLKSHLADNKLNGFLRITNVGNFYKLGLDANLDIENFKANSVNFIEVAATGSYTFKNIDFNLKAGFQTGGTSNDIQRGGLIINASMNYQINSLISFKANLFTGLRRIYLDDLYILNPYFDNNYKIDYSYEIPSLFAILYYHPNQYFSANLGLNFGSSQRRQVFYNDTTVKENIILDYMNTNYFKFFGEAFWELSEVDKMTSRLDFDYSLLSENSNIAPYTPLLQFSTYYYRKWFDNLFGTKFGIVYIGERFADLENDLTIDGFIDLNMEVDYYVYKEFIISLKLKNLLNSDIYIWEGYKERGIYFGLNANYLF